ncbi:MAG TPA: hypothetical protein VLG71_01060 [Candidatus Limnocylindria bacterium]|nr:hypothetical protein [Candidatus Limnocylindria bacterium]
MVTVEQGSIQDQAASSGVQTQNPQSSAPTNLQPNVANNSNLQNVVNTQSLFSNPNSSATITVQTNGSSIESLLASEAAPNNSPSNHTLMNVLFLCSVAILIVVGSFLIFKKLSPKAKR